MEVADKWNLPDDGFAVQEDQIGEQTIAPEWLLCQM
jgi:hypothetical protein